MSLAAGATLTGSFTAAVSTGEPADAAVYFDRGGAAWWADQHWNGSLPDMTNPIYPGCTNYVSQMWVWGGGIGENPDWMRWNVPFINANQFVNYHTNHHYQGGQHVASGWTVGPDGFATANTSAWMGDVFVYAWHDNVPWEHIAIHTYNHWVGVDTNAYYNGYQNVVYDKNVDVMNQHDTDRLGAPWNGVFWSAISAGDDAYTHWYSKVVHVNA